MNEDHNTKKAHLDHSWQWYLSKKSPLHNPRRSTSLLL